MDSFGKYHKIIKPEYYNIIIYLKFNNKLIKHYSIAEVSTFNIIFNNYY